MRPSRALIAASLFLAAAVALTGCTATPPAATAGSVTVIDVWLADYEFPHFLDPIRAQADRFGREHPGYQVKIEAFDYLTMPERIAAAGRAGKGPDVAQYYYTASQEARDTVGANGRPLFAPIGTEIAGRKEILGVPVVVDDLVPAARDYYSFGGVPFSMPKNVSTAVLYSNMEMLTAAGVTQPPQTWSELEADCAAIARTATHPPNCVTWANQGWFFQEAVGEQGGLLVDNDNGRSGRAEAVDLASPAMMAWVGWWKKLTDEGYYVYTGTQQDFIGTTQAFLSQQVAFTFNSSVPADFFVGVAAGSGFTAQVSRLPYNGDAPYAGNQVGGDSLFLAAGLDPKTRDGALAFMQYLDAPDNTIAAHQVGGFIPVTRTAIEALSRQGYYDQKPYELVPIDQLQDVRRYAPGPVALTAPPAQGALLGDFARIEDVMTQAMEDVLVRGADPFGRFTQATADAQALLDRYNAAHPTGTGAGV